MYYINNHPWLVLLLSSFPLTGWLISKLPNKIIWLILTVYVILFVPILLGYSYLNDAYNAEVLYFCLCCVYAFIFNGRDRKFISCLKNTAVSFAVFGLVAFMGVMFGTVTIKQEWSLKEYQIKYIEERGFSGGPLMRYELNKYTAYSMFIKNIDNQADTARIKTCLITFKSSGLTFNKCQPDSSYLIIK